MLNRTYLRLVRARLKREQEQQEKFNNYLKSIEPLISMYWYLFVAPRMLASLEVSFKSPEDKIVRN